MAILDLDKISIQQTVFGIRCINCGGNLSEKKHVFLVGIIRVVSFGKWRPRLYECDTCKKKHLLLH